MRHIKRRDSLTDLINDWHLGVGVEVGVYQGDCSALLLRRCPALHLYCVDPWDGTGTSTPFDGDQVMAQAHKALMATGNGRFTIMRMGSIDAAARFADHSLDFVYIDALHTYDAVRADLVAWHPKLRPGGLFAGHDYKNLGRRKQVRRAVDELFSDVNATNERCPSWWVQMS